jgi:hypothetical protein
MPEHAPAPLTPAELAELRAVYGGGASDTDQARMLRHIGTLEADLDAARAALRRLLECRTLAATRVGVRVGIVASLTPAEANQLVRLAWPEGWRGSHA